MITPDFTSNLSYEALSDGLLNVSRELRKVRAIITSTPTGKNSKEVDSLRIERLNSLVMSRAFFIEEINKRAELLEIEIIMNRINKAS